MKKLISILILSEILLIATSTRCFAELVEDLIYKIVPKEHVEIGIGGGWWRECPYEDVVEYLWDKEEFVMAGSSPKIKEWTIRWFLTPKLQIGFSKGSIWTKRGTIDRIGISPEYKGENREVSFEGNYEIGIIGYKIKKWDLLIGCGIGTYDILLVKEKTPVDGSKGTTITRIDGDTWGGEIFAEREYKINEKVGTTITFTHVIAKVTDLKQAGRQISEPSHIDLTGLRYRFGLLFHF